jgi:hypothetical protein
VANWRRPAATGRFPPSSHSSPSPTAPGTCPTTSAARSVGRRCGDPVFRSRKKGNGGVLRPLAVLQVVRQAAARAGIEHLYLPDLASSNVLVPAIPTVTRHLYLLGDHFDPPPKPTDFWESESLLFAAFACRTNAEDGQILKTTSKSFFLGPVMSLRSKDERTS